MIFGALEARDLIICDGCPMGGRNAETTGSVGGNYTESWSPFQQPSSFQLIQDTKQNINDARIKGYEKPRMQNGKTEEPGYWIEDISPSLVALLPRGQRIVEAMGHCMINVLV